MNGTPPTPPGGLAGWLIRHRWARVILVAATFPAPFTNLLSGALLVLTVRLAGWRQAGIDALLAFGLLAAFLAGLGGAWQLPAAAAAGFWAGSVLAGHLLDRYGSLTLPCQVLVACGAVGVLAAGLLMPAAGEFWRPVLEELLGQAQLPGAPAGSDWTGLLAAQMNGLLAASTLVSIMLALLLGQWLANRGGGPDFGLQFATLRMGRVIGGAAMAALLLVLAGAGAGALAGSLLLVFGVGFALQGLAVVHWTARQRRWPRAWPLAVYLPLALSPPVAGVELLLLAVLGFVDNWLSLRPGLLKSGDVLK